MTLRRKVAASAMPHARRVRHRAGEFGSRPPGCASLICRGAGVSVSHFHSRVAVP